LELVFIIWYLVLRVKWFQVFGFQIKSPRVKADEIASMLCSSQGPNRKNAPGNNRKGERLFTMTIWL